MEKLIYFFGCILLFTIWLFIFYLRSDLRKKMIEISIFGGIFGPIAELWYFADYWRPPSLFGIAVPSIEDFLFGFSIVGICASIYYFIFNKKQRYENKSIAIVDFLINKKLISIVLNIIILMIILNNLLKINSIFASSFIFLICSIFILFKRKKLLSLSVTASLFLPLLILPIYHLILNIIITPDFFQKYWLLNNTFWGIKILGNIPITELIWYFAAGSFFSVLYEFVTES